MYKYFVPTQCVHLWIVYHMLIRDGQMIIYTYILKLSIVYKYIVPYFFGNKE